MTYIVKIEHKLFKKLSAEWDKHVVCGWFDENNTEDAGNFVSRAENFFEAHGEAGLQHYVSLMQSCFHTRTFESI